MSDSHDLQGHEEEKPQEIGGIDLSPVVAAMQEWEKQFSRDVLRNVVYNSRKKLKGLFRKNEIMERSAEDIDKDRLPKFEAIQRKFSVNLRHTGLAIETVPVALSKHDELQQRRGVFSMKDRKIFLSYLDAVIDAEQHTTAQATSVAQVIDSLKYELIENYDLKDPNDDRMINLLAILPHIVQRIITLRENGFFDEIKRADYINFESNLDELQSCSLLLKQHILPEFLMALRVHIASMEDLRVQNDNTLTFKLEAPRKSTFHCLYPMKSTPQEFSEQWKHVASVIETMRTNHHADDLRILLTERLMTILEGAKYDLDSKGQNHRPDREKIEIRCIIDEIYDRLTTTEA